MFSTPVLRLPLLREGPTMPRRTYHDLEQKSLLCREVHCGFGVLVCSTYFTAELMEHRSKHHGSSEAETRALKLVWP
jgi:hypothetical protein